ncbi:MAG TPA: hypothetical protein VLQ91_16965 [Draconibacterium sp.]|nr:hypothetical protein [Draconibacterium sp.]
MDFKTRRVDMIVEIQLGRIMSPLRGLDRPHQINCYNPDSPSGFGLYKLSCGNFKNRELIIWQSEFGPKPRRIDMIMENQNTFSWKNQWVDMIIEKANIF